MWAAAIGRYGEYVGAAVQGLVGNRLARRAWSPQRRSVGHMPVTIHSRPCEPCACGLAADSPGSLRLEPTPEMQYVELPEPDFESLREEILRRDDNLGLRLIACSLAEPDREEVMDAAFQVLTFLDTDLVANALEAIEHVCWRTNRVPSVDALNKALEAVATQCSSNDFVRSNFESLCEKLTFRAERDGSGKKYTAASSRLVILVS